MISILFISLLNYVLSVSTELDSLEVPFVTTSPHYLYSKRVTDDKHSHSSIYSAFYTIGLSFFRTTKFS